MRKTFIKSVYLAHINVEILSVDDLLGSGCEIKMGQNVLVVCVLSMDDQSVDLKTDCIDCHNIVTC